MPHARDKRTHDEEEEVRREERAAKDGGTLRPRAGSERRELSGEVLGDKVAVRCVSENAAR